MKEYIGIVKMKVYTTAVHVQLDKECYLAINSKEIVFKPTSLKISIPTIDDYKRYTLTKNKKFGFAHKTIPNEEFEGLYKMYKKEEYFILKKIKE